MLRGNLLRQTIKSRAVLRVAALCMENMGIYRKGGAWCPHVGKGKSESLELNGSLKRRKPAKLPA